MWASKLAQVLKIPTDTERAASLNEMFNAEREYDLEPGLSEFVQAVPVVLNYSQLADLDDRVALLDEAVAVLNKALPCEATQSAGLQTATALTTFPMGSKLVSAAKAHLAQGKLTQQRLPIIMASFEGLAQRIRDLRSISMGQQRCCHLPCQSYCRSYSGLCCPGRGLLE